MGVARTYAPEQASEDGVMRLNWDYGKAKWAVATWLTQPTETARDHTLGVNLKDPYFLSCSAPAARSSTSPACTTRSHCAIAPSTRLERVV